MFKFEEKLAVIATVRDKLAKNETGITANDVKQMSADLENRTGHAVLNEFTARTLNIFFSRHSDYFRYDRRDPESENPIYEIRTDAHGDIVKDMIHKLDPRLNYPLDFLQATGLLSDLGVEA